MDFKVIRDTKTEKSTIGKLYVNQSTEPYCHTLEPPIKTDGTKPRCTPPGTYPLTLRYSHKHQRDVPHVENVPGFSEVEIHIGNKPEDTIACTLVGKSRGEDYIYHSAEVFEPLVKFLAAIAGPHTITYAEDFIEEPF